MIVAVTAGTVIEVEAREGDWYRVVFPPDAQGLRKVGYISATLVELFVPSPSQTAQPPAAPPLSGALPSAAPSPSAAVPKPSPTPEARTESPASQQIEKDPPLRRAANKVASLWRRNPSDQKGSGTAKGQDSESADDKTAEAGKAANDSRQTLRSQVVREMTSDRIEEAIRAGKDEDYRVGPRLAAGSPHFTTPFSRVVAAAKAAKAAFQPFSVRDVTAEMVAQEIVVTVLPLSARERIGGGERVNGVKAVVILPVGVDDAGKAIQPLRPPQRSGSGLGDTFVAVFPLDALSEDHELVIIGDFGRPRRYRFRLDGVR